MNIIKRKKGLQCFTAASILYYVNADNQPSFGSSKPYLPSLRS